MKRFKLQAALVAIFSLCVCQTEAQDETSRAQQITDLFEKIVPRYDVERRDKQDSLDELVARLLPTEKENKWLQIPWRTDILVARREALQQGKPIFMWLMDGDPLGCT